MATLLIVIVIAQIGMVATRQSFFLGYNNERFSVGVGPGNLLFFCGLREPYLPVEWPAFRRHGIGRDWLGWMQFVPIVHVYKSTWFRSTVVAVSFPGWIMIVIAALLLFWRRKASTDGFCNTCGYDLAGNTSKVCPECGTPCPPQALRDRD